LAPAARRGYLLGKAATVGALREPGSLPFPPAGRPEEPTACPGIDHIVDLDEGETTPTTTTSALLDPRGRLHPQPRRPGPAEQQPGRSREPGAGPPPRPAVQHRPFHVGQNLERLAQTMETTARWTGFVTTTNSGRSHGLLRRDGPGPGITGFARAYGLGDRFFFSFGPGPRDLPQPPVPPRRPRAAGLVSTSIPQPVRESRRPPG